MEELVQLLQQYPVVSTVLAVIGGLRLVMKPLFSLLHALVEVIPGDKDNQLLAKIEGSKVYTSIVYVLDYLTSIKLLSPPKK